jgi:hypothetical protein
MLVQVEGRKLNVNWIHDPVRNMVEDWLHHFSEKLEALDEATRMSLMSLLKTVAPKTRIKYPGRNWRNGYTTCVIEAVEGEIVPGVTRIEATAECSSRHIYRKERGRVVSLEKAADRLAQLLVTTPISDQGSAEEQIREVLARRRVIREEIFDQYADRIPKKSQKL